MAAQSGMVSSAIFQDLQARIDEDTAVRDVRGNHQVTRDDALITRRNCEISSKHSRNTVSRTRLLKVISDPS